MAEYESQGASLEGGPEMHAHEPEFDVSLDEAQDEALEPKDAESYTGQMGERIPDLLERHAATQLEEDDESALQTLRLMRTAYAGAFAGLKHGDVSDLELIKIESETDDEGRSLSISGLDKDGNATTYVFEEGTMPVTIHEDVDSAIEQLPMTYREFMAVQDLLAVAEMSAKEEEQQ